MLKHIITITALMLPIAALAGEAVVPLLVATTGVDGESLSATPVTDAIDMLDNSASNQLAITLAVTSGTSTRVRLYCSEGESSTVASMAQINLCDAVAPVSSCAPDTREYTLSNYTASGGVRYITARFGFKKRWASCTVDDPDNGTGTVVITGTRSWQ